jgi:hypothetical protein
MPRQRGFAHLTRPQQHYSGSMGQRLANRGFGLAIYHHCYFNDRR